MKSVTEVMYCRDDSASDLLSLAERSFFMSKYIDITGQKFGKLTVFKRVENDKNLRAVWECKCDCGKVTTVSGKNIRSGNTKSCGCLSSRNTIGKRTYKHGMSHKRLHNIRSLMIMRCHNSGNPNYINYGKRGIYVCDEWRNSFVSFMNWSNDNGYSENLVIDRIDNDGPYSPDNCRWVTNAENVAAGRKRKPNTNKTGYTGVHYCNTNEKYYAQLGKSGKRYRSIGFDTSSEAYIARIELEIKYIGKQVTFDNE